MEKGTSNGLIRYPDRVVTSKGVRTQADLLLIPLTPWRGRECNEKKQCTAGGYDAIGGMGMINLQVGTSDSNYEFEFRFVAPGHGSKSEAIVVDEVFLEIFDIDKGTDDVVETIVVDATQVAGIPKVGSNVELLDESQKDGSWQWGFVAKESSGDENNPTSLVHINEEQEAVKARVQYKNVGSFKTRFGVGKRRRGTGARNFYFSLNECPAK